MRKRKQKVYPEHPCVTCGEITTNVNYCDKHLKMYTSPIYLTKAPIGITASMERLDSKSPIRRREQHTCL